jgi:hypothetical protein
MKIVVLAHHPNSVSVPLLRVANVWRTSHNAVNTKFAARTFCPLA